MTEMEENSIFILPVSPFSSNQYFPSDVLKWMKKNSTPTMLLKLMQICKYFQLKKFPYIVVKKTVFHQNIWSLLPALSKKEATNFSNLNTFPNRLVISGVINLTKCLTISQFISKIEICDISALHLYDQNMSFIEFTFFTKGGKLKELILENSKVKDRHGDGVPFEHVLRCLPKAKYIYIRRAVPSMKCSKDLEDITFSKDLKIELWFINRNFNFKEFSQFMIKNQQINYVLSFNYKKKEFLKLMKRILNAWNPKYKVPYLTFRGGEDKEITKLRQNKISDNFEQTKINNTTKYYSICNDWDML